MGRKVVFIFLAIALVAGFSAVTGCEEEKVEQEGIAAIDLILQENYGRMVSYLNGQITSVPIVDIVGKTQTVDIKTFYDTERLNGRRTILNLPR